MREYIIDCSGITDPEVFHDALVEALTLPKWYGTNLDALYDCLTSVTEETTVRLLQFESLKERYAGLRAVLQDAEEANPRITILLE